MRVKLKVHRQPEEVRCAWTLACLPEKCIDIKYKNSKKEACAREEDLGGRVCMPSRAQIVLLQTTEAGHGGAELRVRSVEF